MGFSTQNNLDMSTVGLFGGGTNKDNLYNQIFKEKTIVVSKMFTLENDMDCSKIGTIPITTSIYVYIYIYHDFK